MAIWAAGIAAAGSYLSSQGSEEAAGEASDAQAEASKEAAQLEYKQYLQNRQDMLRQQNRSNYMMEPYQTAGYNALNALQYGMGFGDPNAVARTEYNFDADKFREVIQKRIDDANPVTKIGLAAWRKLPAEKRQIRSDAYKKLKADIAKGLAGGEFNYYQNQKAQNKGGWIPEEGLWKQPQGGQGAQGGEGGRFGFGDYGFLTKRFGLDDFEKEPGYEFRRSEGNRGIEASAAARGGLQSGAALKALNRFNQDYASNEYGNAYNRFSADQGNIFNRLSGLAGTGQSQTNLMASGNMNTAQTLAGMGSQAAQTRGNALTDAANARASGFIGAANAQNQMWNNIGQAGMNYWAMKNV